ncbi:MAG: PEP-CTERM sorting domain-containing protein [Gammaproteobacteria bacterium]
MKKNHIHVTCVLFIFLFISHQASAATQTFNFTPSASELVSENDSAPFTASVDYSGQSWQPGRVTSATLTLFLSDDVSSTFLPNIDAPREWAQLMSVSAGASALSAADLPAAVEVDPQPFQADDPLVAAAATQLGTDPAVLVSIAANAGIENPAVLPSTSGYFDVDVTSLLNNSNSGLLEFSLIALALYSDITDATNPEALNFINAVNQSSIDSFPVNEDFLFDQAQLTVEFVPEPSLIWLLSIGLVGMSTISRNGRYF